MPLKGGEGMKLTDERKKMIIADYVITHNFCETARNCGVSATSVRNVVHAEPEFADRLEQKKAEIGDRVVQYLASKEDKLYRFIDTYLDAMLDPDKIKAASVNQLSTTFGTVLDKFVNLKAVTGDAANNVCIKIDSSLKELSE